MSLRAADHLLHLLVGVFRFPCAKLVKPGPERNQGRVDDLTGHIQEAQRIRLSFVRKSKGIT